MDHRCDFHSFLDFILDMNSIAVPGNPLRTASIIPKCRSCHGDATPAHFELATIDSMSCTSRHGSLMPTHLERFDQVWTD